MTKIFDRIKVTGSYSVGVVQKRKILIVKVRRKVRTISEISQCRATHKTLLEKRALGLITCEDIPRREGL